MVNEEERERLRWQQFFSTAQSGDTAALDRALSSRRPEDERGVVYEWVELRDPREKTAYMIAAENGHAHAVRFLRDRGADPRAVSAHGETALHLAAATGQLGSVELLLAEGVLDVDAQAGAGETALLIASTRGHRTVVAELLRARARSDLADRRGSTPLHGAAQNNHLETATLLLESGADILAYNRAAKTPLMLSGIKMTQLFWFSAARAGHVEGVRHILARQIGSEGDAGWRDLGRALYHPEGQDQVPLNLHREMLDSRDADGFTALSHAAQRGHVKLAEYLLSQAADPGLNDGMRETPLHHAARSGHAQLAQMLCDASAPLEALNTADGTPLHVAAFFGRHDVVRTLLGANASPDATDTQHATPLHYATFRGNDECIQALVGGGAGLDIRDKEYRTPFDVAQLARRARSKPRPRVAEHADDYEEGLEAYSPPPPPRAYVVRHATRVAVRDGPSTSAKAVGMRLPGEKVLVKEVVKGWARLDLGDGGGNPGGQERWMLVDGPDADAVGVRGPLLVPVAVEAEEESDDDLGDYAG